jgi:membrane protein implicated in regulation of membrane protease activity
MKVQGALQVAPDAAEKRHPHIAWRIAFWASVSAWIAATIVIALSVVFAVGFGVISLFAGSLGGFFTFWLGAENYSILFFAPLLLIALLYVARPFVRGYASPASVIARSSAALIGIVIGMLLTYAAVNIMWTGVQARNKAIEPTQNAQPR